ncbi:MAG: nicotinate-nucleotide adenylyltransferase [Halieaceae bacterium]|nr:nicotinate-nucleotide adenylyltransferase [Halieaceae bacterium]
MSEAARSAGIEAVYGGTFNPIHLGHLRSAAELLERLPIRRLRFIPAALPPHRVAPEVSADHRAAMVEAAIADQPRMLCDRRELTRDGPSYTVDTLESLRGELGDSAPLLLVMGADAALGLRSWHRWGDLFNLAHILIMARPGWDLPQRGDIADLLRERQVDADQLASSPAGAVCRCELRPWPVSSTEIRALLQSDKDARSLLPPAVASYIREHGLYAGDAGTDFGQ